MKLEDAIRPLKKLSDLKKMADQCDQSCAEDIRLYHALDAGIAALKKQMPQKPVWKDEPCKYPDRTEMVKCLHCPDCGELLDFHYSMRKLPYCWKCGKALAWE